MTVTITFKTPAREHGKGGRLAHERKLTGVPKAEAEQMAEDFVLYQSEGGDAQKSELYRYEKDGKEVLVALDFQEIVALRAMEEE